jgi:signal transduction histidine kinase
VHPAAWLESLLARTSRTLFAAVFRLQGFMAALGRGVHGALDRMLSAAAHEFRTPLAVVRAEAQILARERGADARLANITRQVDRLTHLVEQVLEAARLPFGAAPTVREVVELQHVVAGVVRRFERSTRNHQFRMSHRRSPIWVRADPQRIALALANVIDNAVRFSPRGGIVDVALRVMGRDAIVSVRDEGVGIPVHLQARIFDVGHRVHAATKHEYTGIGIGLALTRRILAEHGGAVSFKSTAGHGSTFTVSLPLVSGSA